MTGIKKLRNLSATLGEGQPFTLEEIYIGGKTASDWLADVADQIERETLPRPRFEDGEPVQFGDEFVAWNGTVGTVSAINVVDNARLIVINSSSSNNYIVGAKDSHGRFAKRPEPEDSWERLEADVKMGMCEYFGCQRFGCYDGEDCPAHDAESCFAHAYLDLVRRCKALAGVE